MRNETISLFIIPCHSIFHFNQHLFNLRGKKFCSFQRLQKLLIIIFRILNQLIKIFLHFFQSSPLVHIVIQVNISVIQILINPNQILHHVFGLLINIPKAFAQVIIILNSSVFGINLELMQIFFELILLGPQIRLQIIYKLKLFFNLGSLILKDSNFFNYSWIPSLKRILNKFIVVI